MSLCPMWPIFVPFQGVMLCKNGQKLLKINISWMFWPNNVWIFLITLFYEICLVEHIFNILLLLFPIFVHVLAFWRLCKNGPKLLKINMSCMFWPNNVGNLFYCIILWNIFSRAYFQHFFVILSFLTKVWPLWGGNVV